MLELKNISKYYNAGTVNEMCLFNDFNLSIDDGEFVSVVGSNGSGKTSMLNLICGSISADAGKVIVNGTDITGQKEYMCHRKIGRVYQNSMLTTRMTKNSTAVISFKSVDFNPMRSAIATQAL